MKNMGLNIDEAVARACEQPTLVDALTWICVWESERVVQQARREVEWETCFRICIQRVMDNYER